ncbi:MAG TPA: HNH endonuclease signature motif containing protein [Capillimicrobium sp.]|nr:HNH endonuclease signature motif containing protein [Capillimicrobium sp.]
MLRECPDARFESTRSLAGRRWFLVRGERVATAAWPGRRMRAMAAAQRREPVALFHDGGRTWWWFEDRVYWEDEGLAAADVLALVRERDRRRRRTLERAHAALAAEAGAAVRRQAGREPIPREVRLAVWRRDGGRCVSCGGDFDLQYDHVIPVALGGASTVENLQVLCAPCNRRKGAALA